MHAAFSHRTLMNDHMTGHWEEEQGDKNANLPAVRTAADDWAAELVEPRDGLRCKWTGRYQDLAWRRYLIVSQFEAPATETERSVARIWGEVLNLSEVGVTDNFFDLGGHSLLLHMVHDKLGASFADVPSVVELFQHTTVRQLAQRLDHGAVTPARSRARNSRVPSSLSRLRQRRGGE
ncbi:hypothetical protein D5S17_05740 [Pseudonocardiaceae bacterium YIM PH 21723]|nr:hypothetical protein D5S17_05740 [Pseudonocardiaceae bacterium YIM PH 21723]